MLEQWSGTVITTEAVLTETLYLVGSSWKAQHICLEFFARGAFVLIPSSTASLKRDAELMKKYHDLPMDFADATLVALGEELDSDQVFTLDRRGFAVYRLHGKKTFRIIP